MILAFPAPIIGNGNDDDDDGDGDDDDDDVVVDDL
jgi:hypothetical protein